MNTKYILNVWLASIIIPVSVIQIFAVTRDSLFLGANQHFSVDFLLPNLVGLVVSLPYLVLFVFLIRKLEKTSYAVYKIKAILLIFNLVFISVIFLAIWGLPLLLLDLPIWVTYTTISSMCLLFFKFHKPAF